MEGELSRIKRPVLREYFGVLGGVVVFAISLVNPDASHAETPTECSRRLASLVGSDLVEKKGDQLFIPAAILQKHPLFFRNLIVQVYSQPFLSPFFQGFEKAPRSLHAASRGLEVPRIITELDRQQDYTFENILEALEQILAGEDSSAFELDISRIKKEGIYLNFVQAPAGQNDVRLRLMFARAWAKQVASQRAPIPLPILRYKGTNGSYLVESAFYLAEIYENTRKYVVDELMLPWGSFEEFFKNRYRSKIIRLQLPSERGGFEKVSLTVSRRFKSGGNIVYELRSDSPVVLEGVTSLAGSTVTWEQTGSGRIVGFVAAKGQDSLELSWASLAGAVTQEFSF